MKRPRRAQVEAKHRKVLAEADQVIGRLAICLARLDELPENEEGGDGGR